MQPQRWYLDTSVLVAACAAEHPHHSRAQDLLSLAAEGKHRCHISAHGIAECYSVLTRAPFQPRIRPDEALKMIDALVTSGLSLVPLTGEEYLTVIEECAASGIAGGRTHDAIHLRCAAKARCYRIYTFDIAHFREIAPRALAALVSAP